MVPIVFHNNFTLSVLDLCYDCLKFQGDGMLLSYLLHGRPQGLVRRLTRFPIIMLGRIRHPDNVWPMSPLWNSLAKSSLPARYGPQVRGTSMPEVLMRTWLAVFCCFGSASAQTPAPALGVRGAPVNNIELNRPEDIADAGAVNRAITVMVKRAASCTPVSALEAQHCACSFTDDLKILNNAYKAAVAKHPSWKAEGSVLAYVDPANGKSIILNLPSVRRQLDACQR
jgi:hypothetical protein